MKKYNNCKDSGINWIGDIPTNWELKRLRYLFDIIPSNIDKKSVEEEEEVLLCNYVDVYKNDKISSEIDFMKATASDAQIEKLTLKLNDVIATKDSEDPNDIGVPALVVENMKGVVCGYHLTLFRSIESKVSGRYLFWYLKSKMCSQYFSTLARGITRYALGTSSFSNLSIVYPNKYEEQEWLASFLDHKTNQIDKLIHKKEHLIQLLQEERTAIINQAVTKGLDPNVPMKDSGIEWLGEIPAHWESWKISHAFNRIGSGTTPESGNPKYHENGTVNWLNTGDLNDGILDGCSKKVTEKALEDYSSLKIFPSGSLVMAMYGATIGKTSIINFDTTTNQACCVFCEGNIIGVNFLQYWFIAKKEHIINLAIGGGQPNISQNILKDIRVCCPDVTEQNEVVKFIKNKTNEIDTIISKAEQEIELLKEYKTALISEVVTGKIDVRDEVIN